MSKLEVVDMVKKVRFNSMMKETTRKKLHELAVREGRSDSNMVEYLIDSYNTVNGDGKGAGRECGKKQ